MLRTSPLKFAARRRRSGDAAPPGLMDALTHHRFFIREHRFEEAQAAPGAERLFTGVRKQKVAASRGERPATEPSAAACAKKGHLGANAASDGTGTDP